ncbi:MAG: TrmB family transcriptional regulator [Brevinemataceae bacterium]
MQEFSSHLLDRFEKLGLSRNEASVYMALLKYQSVTGYKLAKESGILRPVVYEMLTRLLEKGGVKVIKNSPELYSPITPEIFLATLEKRFLDAKLALDGELKQFIIPKENNNTEFWNIYGYDSIIASIIEACSHASSQIFFFVNRPQDAALLKDIFSKKVASGIKVVGFSYRDINLPGTDLYSFKAPEHIKFANLSENALLIIVDNSYSIIADMEIGKSSYTSNPVQIQILSQFIKMKITLFRLVQVIPLSKLLLYFFDEDKIILETLASLNNQKK